MLHQHRAKLQQQLERMEAIAVVGGRRVGGQSVLRGRKVPPKYRGPSGETWAGRGARPRWLVAAIKGGKKLEALRQGRCAGYVAGLVYARSVYLCVPEGATPEQGVRVVIKYVEARPERMQEPFGKLALEALEEAWPCKR